MTARIGVRRLYSDRERQQARLIAQQQQQQARLVHVKRLKEATRTLLEEAL